MVTDVSPQYVWWPVVSSCTEHCLSAECAPSRVSLPAWVELRLAPERLFASYWYPRCEVMSDRGDLPRLIVRPFHGRKGAEYTTWRRELLDALALKGDDDFSLAETVERTDRRAGWPQRTN